jgi:hypothetical protein
MKFDDIYPVSHKRTDVTKDEIVALEQQLKVNLPQDFWGFMQRFGPGEFCGSLAFFGPRQFLEHQELCKNIWNEYFFWDAATLSKEEVLQSISVATSIDGDEIVYKSAKKTGYYVLLRHADEIQKIGNTISEALNWFSSSGVISMPTKFKWFCTFKDRCKLHIIKDDGMGHSELLTLIETAFETVHTESSSTDIIDLSILFCQKISGFIQFHSDRLDLRIPLTFDYDLEFDSQVRKIVEEVFYSRGFRFHHS